MSNQVRVWCGVYGEGTVFSVKIAVDATVEELQEAIFEKNRYRERFRFAASDLKLYLARKDKDWLPDNDDVTRFLRAGVSAEYKVMMRPSWQLNKPELLGSDFKTAVEVIHVLVELPEAAAAVPPPVAVALPEAAAKTTDLRRLHIHELVDADDVRKELVYYQQRGHAIHQRCQKTFCAQVLKAVDNLYSKKMYPLPFVCVEGSSGMGKSQLAFALEGDRPWFYWLATPISANSQPLYRNFSSISDAFKVVVQQDNPTKSADEDVLRTDSNFYLTTELWTYGFICALLEYWSSCENGRTGMIRISKPTEWIVKPCNLETARGVVKEVSKGGKKLPFFILDEMTPNANIDAGGKNKAAFQRNVFRVCGLVVVIMGTDSKVTNLITQVQGSYGGEHEWMTLIPIFPTYQFTEEEQSWLNGQQHLVVKQVVEAIARHSRGRFARHFMERVMSEASEIPLWCLLDNAFANVSEKTRKRKQHFMSFDGKSAQLMAISYTNSDEDTEPPTKKRRVDVGTFGMHLHFANLIDKEVKVMFTRDGELWKDDGATPWKPKCCFPAIEEDVLLYLAILGGKEHPSYYDYRMAEDLSTKWIFSDTKRFSVDENTNAISKNYKTFENMVAHAIFCSSRRNGVQGIPFDDFFRCLLGEFQARLWMKVKMHYGDLDSTVAASALLERCTDVSMLVIPFLAPPNAEWPEFITNTNDYGCNFGHLVRARNDERCDVYVQALDGQMLILCECKNWAKNVDMTAMKGIVDGLDAKWKWKFALVFCAKLASFRSQWPMPSIGCVKIDSEDGRVQWIITEEKLERIVIVVETGVIDM